MWSAAAARLPHVAEHTATTTTVPNAATASRSPRAADARAGRRAVSSMPKMGAESL